MYDFGFAGQSLLIQTQLSAVSFRTFSDTELRPNRVWTWYVWYAHQGHCFIINVDVVFRLMVPSMLPFHCVNGRLLVCYSSCTLIVPWVTVVATRVARSLYITCMSTSLIVCQWYVELISLHVKGTLTCNWFLSQGTSWGTLPLVWGA